MQPSAPPPMPPPAPFPAQRRNRFVLLLALGAIALLAIGGVVGYVIGSAGIGHATLVVSVANNTPSALNVQILVNGQLASTLTVGSGQTASVSVPVAYATANGAYFQVQAVSAQGPRDSDTVFVNSPATFAVSLTLG